MANEWWNPKKFTRPYSEMPGISDPNIGLAAGHAAAGDMYTFPDGLNVRDAQFYHRLAYAAAGSTNVFSFFTVNESMGVCNLPGGAQGLPNDYLFLLEGVGFHLDTTQQVDHTANATSPYSTGAVTSATVAGQAARILHGGNVNLKVGDMDLIRDVYGLRNFPSNAAPECFASLASAGTDTFAWTMNGKNDNAIRGFRFTYPKVIYPNKPIRLTVQFPTAIATANACVLEAQLFGQLITPGTTI